MKTKIIFYLFFFVFFCCFSYSYEIYYNKYFCDEINITLNNISIDNYNLSNSLILKNFYFDNYSYNFILEKKVYNYSLDSFFSYDIDYIVNLSNSYYFFFEVDNIIYNFTFFFNSTKCNFNSAVVVRSDFNNDFLFEENIKKRISFDSFFGLVSSYKFYFLILIFVLIFILFFKFL